MKINLSDTGPSDLVEQLDRSVNPHKYWTKREKAIYDLRIKASEVGNRLFDLVLIPVLKLITFVLEFIVWVLEIGKRHG